MLLQADISAAEQTLWKSVPTGSPALAWARRSAVHLIRTEKCSLASVFACRFFEKLGYKTLPESGETRTDIIASILLENEKNLVAFCQGIQKGSPVDSYVTPEAWDMPGYDSKVIMAAGAFTMGASIELSADAPIRPPFAAWLQGGITYPTGKAGVMLAAQEMYNKGLLRI